MSDQPSPPKDQTPPQALPVTEEGLISIEGLDQVIQEQDPEFQEQVGDLSAGGLNGSLDLIDLDELLAEQEAKSLRSRLKRLRQKVRHLLVGLRAMAWEFIRSDVPQLAKAALARLKSGAAFAGEMLRQFGFKPLKFKLFVFAFIFLSAGVATAIYLLATRGLPEEDRLFMQSLGEIADSETEYDPKSQEIFYESVRAAQNVLIVPRLLVNLRRTSASGPNPMAIAEIYLEGNSPDVVVEIKMRETEFRDLFMRTMEEFTAEELETAVGKQKLLERLAREANRVVTKGRVRKIFFKNMVLNP